MDIEFEVSDPGIVDAYLKLCEQVPEFVNAATQQAANVVGPLALEDFQQEPGPVKLPIRWTSDKQRRYVMWAKRMGYIPSPYVRSHALSKGWRLIVVYRPGELTSLELWNAEPSSVFVVGARQQPWHKDTGWYTASDKAAYWGAVFVDEIVTALIKAFYAVGEGVS